MMGYPAGYAIGSLVYILVTATRGPVGRTLDLMESPV